MGCIGYICSREERVRQEGETARTGKRESQERGKGGGRNDQKKIREGGKMA